MPRNYISLKSAFSAWASRYQLKDSILSYKERKGNNPKKSRLALLRISVSRKIFDRGVPTVNKYYGIFLSISWLFGYNRRAVISSIRAVSIPKWTFQLIIFCHTIILISLSPAPLCSGYNQPSPKEDIIWILKEIHREVLELGYRQQEPFIKREFFLDLDDNDENKEEHVVILSGYLNTEQKMIIQVTYFQPISKNRLVRQATNSMKILCSLKKEGIIIEECDYTLEQIPLLLPKILEGIKSKKKLLQLIKNGITF